MPQRWPGTRESLSGRAPLSELSAGAVDRLTTIFLIKQKQGDKV